MELDLNNWSETLSNVALSDLTKYATTFCKNVIVAIIVYMIGRFIVQKLCALFQTLLRKKGVDDSLYTFLDSLVNITLNFLLIIVVIGILGVETSSFMALFASAGVAIGLALSGTLQNFAGGVMVLLFKPYKVGDVIEAQGYIGGVTQIQIFNTILCTPDNQTVIIPNGSLATGSLKNYSTQQFRRVDIPVEVAYGSQPDTVRDALNELINADTRILKDAGHEPTIPMTTMGSSSITFELRLWVESANYFAVKFDMTENVYKHFRVKGIEIPFQQLDVHMRSK